MTTHTKPIYGIVTTDGRLSLEFSFEDQMRIRSWHFLIRGYVRYFFKFVESLILKNNSAHEMVPKTICSSALSTDGPTAINEICRLVTRSGLTTATLNFLRLCNIMEPMTELFTFHKVFYFYLISAFFKLRKDFSHGAPRMLEELPLSKMEQNHESARRDT